MLLLCCLLLPSFINRVISWLDRYHIIYLWITSDNNQAQTGNARIHQSTHLTLFDGRDGSLPLLDR